MSAYLEPESDVEANSTDPVVSQCRGRLQPNSTDSSRKKRLALAVRGVLLVGPMLCAGCPDTRISVHELRDRQHQILSSRPTAELAFDRLALTEFQRYRIAPGDILAVTIIGLPGMELSGAAPSAPQIVVNTAGATQTMQADAPQPSGIRVRVYDDGTINLPLIPPLKVEGMDFAGAEIAIRAAYVPDIVQSLAVFVDLAESEVSTTVFVRGAAGLPSVVTLRSNRRNLLYALGQAGAFGPNPSGRVRVQPVRPDQPEVVFDLSDPEDFRRALAYPPLQSGDVVIAEPQPLNAVFVVGLVNLQGPITIAPGSAISVVQALAASGGTREFLDPPEATLWRQLPDGERVRVKLDLASILSGKEPDMDLRAGDVLEVPHTTETRLRHWAINNIRFGPFGIGAFYDPIAVHTFRDREEFGDGGGAGRLIRDSFLFGATNAITQRAFGGGG